MKKEQPVAILKVLENDFLSVKIYSNSYTEIKDLVNNKKWETWSVALQDMSEVEVGEVWLRTGRSLTHQYPGHFYGKMEGNNIRFTLIGRQGLIIGTFLCNIYLEDSWLVFKILEVDESIPSLVYPPPVKSDDIIIPRGVGEIIRSGYDPSNQTTVDAAMYGAMYPRTIYPFYTRLNMRFIGGLKDDAGWIGIFDEGFEDMCGFFANATATPMCIQSLGKWRHPYTYRMKFIQGDYVDLAKVYRQWIMNQGQFVSLEDKIRAKPYLKSLLGGRAFWINLAFPWRRKTTAEDFLLRGDYPYDDGKPLEIRFTYEELEERIEYLKELGLKKGLIKIGGWINGGYDNSHQDIWPPEPSLGTLNELKMLLASEPPVLFALHDNNQDMYAHTPSFPKGVNRNADGNLLTGGVWRGGQAYILNSRYSLKYARRNWEQIKTLEPKAMFVDIITAMQLYQSFEPGDELTKHDDWIAKTELMQFYKDQGAIFGSEEAADFGISYVDWFENRHKRVQSTSIPLWPLVFHDAAFCTRYGGVSGDDGYPGWLEDMLWGYLPHFFVSPDWDQEVLFQSIDHVDQWHEKIGTAEMTDHDFLDADFAVEKTSFSSGDAIICNFSDQPFLYQGKVIEAGDYLIVE
ncbi:MAG: hypothetical protein KFF73_13005 [Cyclobacteriaceae bacterium]|nr:hypothetical protein [Cyclobacteriaceae bacterium]